MLKKKADHEDISSCIRLMEQLYKKIKFMSILQTEVTKELVPPKQSASSIQNTDTAQSKMQRLEYLTKQSEVTMNNIL